MSFEKRLLANEFVVLAEMNTPKGIDISKMVMNARRIKGRVDAVVIPDMDNGVMRMSALAGGVLMQQQGLESIIHIYCRDRNRMALQGDILAAHVLGIQNLIVVNSEEMTNGDHRDAQPVFDVNEMELLGVIQSLQKGVDIAGFELEGSPSFITGCTLGVFMDEKDLNKEIETVRKKINAGAQFIITPPIFDIARFQSLMEKIEHLGVPIISTVFLLKSVAIARYIAIHEPGGFLSETTVKRIRKAKDREMEGIRIAGETIAAMKGLSQGVLIQTLGWEHRLGAILDAAEL